MSAQPTARNATRLATEMKIGIDIDKFKEKQRARAKCYAGRWLRRRLRQRLRSVSNTIIVVYKFVHKIKAQGLIRLAPALAYL